MGVIIKFKRTIRQGGRSAIVAIPPEIMQALSWKVGIQIMISVTQDKAVLIEKA